MVEHTPSGLGHVHEDTVQGDSHVHTDISQGDGHVHPADAPTAEKVPTGGGISLARCRATCNLCGVVKSQIDSTRAGRPGRPGGDGAARRRGASGSVGPMIAGFKAQNHPLQVAGRGSIDEVDDRGTPPEDFGPWHARWGFTLDVAAAPHNAKCKRYFTRQDDGLSQSWAGERVWCNPPYSDLGAWAEKAWSEWKRLVDPSELIVMLVPANRGEQGWWQRWVEPSRDRAGSPLRTEILPGRIRFKFPDGVPAPKHNRPMFGCCLLIWGDGPGRPTLPDRSATDE